MAPEIPMTEASHLARNIRRLAQWRGPPNPPWDMKNNCPVLIPYPMSWNISCLSHGKKTLDLLWLINAYHMLSQSSTDLGRVSLSMAHNEAGYVLHGSPVDQKLGGVGRSLPWKGKWEIPPRVGIKWIYPLANSLLWKMVHVMHPGSPKNYLLEMVTFHSYTVH